MAASPWELRATLPVLYTAQKGNRRPKFREGVLEINCGRAALLDAGREVDAITVTAVLLQQLRAGADVEFPGHLLQPQHPLQPDGRTPSSPSVSSIMPSRCDSNRPAGMTDARTPVVEHHVDVLERPSEQKVRRPFKRPRVAQEDSVIQVAGIDQGGKSCEQAAGSQGQRMARSSSAPSQAPFKRPHVAQEDSVIQVAGIDQGGKSCEQAAGNQGLCTARSSSAPSQASCTDLWSESVQEDALSRTQFHGMLDTDLWAQCATEDSLSRQCRSKSLQHLDKCSLPRGEPSGEAAGKGTSMPSNAKCIATPCRSKEFTKLHGDSYAHHAVHQTSDGVTSGDFCNVPEVFLRVDGFPENAASDSGDDLPLVGLVTAQQANERSIKYPKKFKHDRKAIRKVASVTCAKAVARKRVERAASEPSVPAFLHLRFTDSLGPVMAMSAPHRFADLSGYAGYFWQVILRDVQARLSDLAEAWKRAAGDVRSLPGEVSIVASNIMVGTTLGGDSSQRIEGETVTVEDEASTPRSQVVLIFGRRTVLVRGRTPSCARGDLWVLLPVGHEPLILRALWRGVSPRGRLLCAAVNQAAVGWINARRGSCNLVMMTGISTSQFAAELEQADALHGVMRNARAVSNAADEDKLLCTILGAADPAHEVARQTSEAQTLPDSVPLGTSELSRLNREQINVVHWVCAWAMPASSSDAVLVRGVFGSGKSCTLASCIVLLDRILTYQKDPRRILLLCQTNAAVDNVLNRLLSHHSWDDFARLGSFKTVHHALLHRTVSLMATRQAAAKELSDALAKLPPEFAASLNKAVERGVLPPKAATWRRRRLVAATAAALSAADHLGELALHCPLVLVDEATQLTEPATFVCLRKAAARRVLLLGDPRQLPPRTRHGPLARSLLERLWDTGPSAARVELLTQYRCHPLLGALAGQLFYGNCITNGIGPSERSSVLGVAAPPLLVILSEGTESRTGHSYQHLAEAQLCATWLHRALLGVSGCLRPADVGVVCLYRPQAAACATQLASRGLQAVEASTVDAFQGSEREVIILSCGRSSAAPSHRNAELGGVANFAACPRRLNVALTRARRHLVVVGSEVFLRSHPHLSKVFEVACARNAVTSARRIFSP
jgi:hypothetical protein